jgi:hypothetical protein
VSGVAGDISADAKTEEDVMSVAADIGLGSSRGEVLFCTPGKPSGAGSRAGPIADMAFCDGCPEAVVAPAPSIMHSSFDLKATSPPRGNLWRELKVG